MKKRSFTILLTGAAVAVAGVAVKRSTDASAQTSTMPRANYLMIDQAVSLPVAPDSVISLIEQTAGDVLPFPAGFITSTVSGQEASFEQQKLVGTRIPEFALQNDRTEVRSTFFITGSDGGISATPVKAWTRDELKANSRPAAELEQDVSAISSKLPPLREELGQLEEALTQLRDQAASLAGIDEIVDLKMEEARLRGTREDRGIELGRLRDAVERARALQDPPDIDVRRQELSGHLRETAQKTAMAERLNARRKDSAVASFKKKIDLVKEMDGGDTESLAREVMALRNQRKELQDRIKGVIRSNPSSDEF